MKGQIQFIFLILIVAVFQATTCSSKSILKGSIKLKDGTNSVGYISYRKIDVATRIVFYSLDPKTKEIDETTKTTFGPGEIMGFSYGENEKWLSVNFDKSELGYDAPYFMKVEAVAHDIYLLGGIITGEGCNCSGTKIDASYFWVLWSAKDQQKTILSEHRYGRITKPEWVSAYFSRYGFEVDPDVFNKPKHVLAPISVPVL